MRCNARVLGMAAWLTALVFVPCALGDETTSAPAEPEPTGQLIEGIVLSHFGSGVAGARVRVESLDAGADDPALAEGTTNNIGDIRIRLPEPVSGPVRVRIRHEGFVDFVQEVDPTDEEDPPFIEATLEGAATLTGVVRAAAGGKPVSEAFVRCDSGGRALQARTDARGRYTIEHVFRGPATLTVIAEAFAIHRSPIRIEADRVEQDVELRRERLVELTVVTTAGDPAAGLVIEALVEPGETYLNTMTDDRGRATLRGVGADAQVVRLRLNGEGYVQMAGFEREIAVAGADLSATEPSQNGPVPIRERVVIEVAGRVRGKVIDAKTREPIVGARVVAGREPRGNMPMIWTALDGTYELAGLSPGVNVLSFQHRAYATAIHETRIDAGGTAKLDARLDAGQPIAGTVVGEDDEPLSQVWVTAERWKGYTTLGLRTLSGDDGAFVLEHVPPGEVELSFLKPGYGSAVRQVIAAGKTDCRIVLERADAPPGAAPGIDVRIPVGRRVPDFTLTATDGTSYKLADLRGKFVFIDVWVSWCKPCAAEVGNIKALHDALSDRADFVLIGVSLDDDRKEFKQFVERHDMDWPQVFGPKSGAEDVFEMLDGFGVPYTCLIGPDGTMLAQHIFGPETAETVARRLPERADKGKD